MAQQADLLVDKGSYRPIVIDVDSDYITDLSVYNGCGMMVRANKNDSAVLADLGSYATINVPNRQVTLAIPANVSSAFTWSQGLYDLELKHSTDPAKTVRILQGTITADSEVTH